MSNKDFVISEPDFLHLEGLSMAQIHSLFLQIKDVPFRIPLLPVPYGCESGKFQIYVDIPFGFCIVRVYSPVYSKPGASNKWFKRVLNSYYDVCKLPF